ncbi:UBA-like domain-containing protein 1 isoform X2 [Lepeophtheirus salmonis]|uniref:UBA-like domain-containing protein 1 isoform X2 n=1 Tax=Lepeophtheirus salmonis TaxID=72036 RepID=UPI001AE4DE5F|nr:UBA-like domain-containing protein 1 isoform X2 [Lepeophtheirus salmonis]
MDTLKENVMINQFVLVAGCSRDQATKILSQAGWQFQTALSMYFQEAAIPKNNAGLALLTPTNTPATPPNFPEALNMFSNMSTSDSSSKMVAASPGPHANSSLSPRGRSHIFQASRWLAPSMGVSNGSTSSFPSSNSNTADCQFQIDNNYIGSSNSVI